MYLLLESPVVCVLVIGVAEVMFNRCVTTNESEGVGKDDKNLLVTFNYEFLEDDRDPKTSKITKGLSRALTR